MKQDTAVIVMAKLPLPGLAKTRLAPVLGEQGAAQLAERMLHEAIGQAVLASIGPVQWRVAPHVAHPIVEQMQREHGVSIAAQGDGDLGARMQRAFNDAFIDHSAALLIGSDMPALDAACLRLAASALRTHDAVFVPAADGGYGLIGLRRAQPALFNNMPWSTAQVMQRTRERLAQLQLTHAELPTLHDVDEPADLVHVPVEWLASIGTSTAATSKAAP